LSVNNKIANATILREYAANKNFYACEMITNDSHTGVYMVKEDFTSSSSGDITDDMSKLLVIKSPT
jgi:hypothetical protein